MQAAYAWKEIEAIKAGRLEEFYRNEPKPASERGKRPFRTIVEELEQNGLRRSKEAVNR